MWNLKKMVQMKLFTKQKQSHKCRKQTYDLPGGKEWREMNWETGIDIYILPYIKQITNKDLLPHMELLSMLCNEINGKRIFKRVHNMCIFKKRRKTRTYNKESNT